MNIHIIELRKRIIYCLFFVTINFLVFFYYSDVIYDMFSSPILNKLPKNSNIISTKITSTFFVPLKLSINLTIIFGLPYIIFHIWSFISPGLYKYEKKKILPFIFFSCILFFFGIIFAFCIILPLALGFFINCSPSNVLIMTDMISYINFTFIIMLSCGLSFQIPIIIYTLIKFDILSKKVLSKSRSYVFVLSFILGMLFTPPDVISQILLAIPIWLLFELGLFFSK